MPNRIGVAVLGAGRWGVHLVRNFLEHPQAELRAILDPDSDRLKAIATRFDLGDRVVLATDWSEFPPSPQVEAVAIATPATTHYSVISTALKQGYHVLAEKPLTLDLAESIALCQLADQQHRQLVVDHTYLFHSAVQQGKAAIAAGALGDLRYGYAARTHLGPVRQDVDALWDLAIHDIAIFNHWLGQTPIRVEAKGTVWLQPASPNAKYFPQGLSDLVWITLTYPSGLQTFIHLCWLNPDKQRRLALTGSQGTLIFDELASNPLTLQRGELEQQPAPEISGMADTQATPTLFVPVNQQCEVIQLEPAEPLRQVCDHFLDCVRQNVPSSISSGAFGADLVKILNALTESLNQGGQPVDLS